MTGLELVVKLGKQDVFSFLVELGADSDSTVNNINYKFSNILKLISIFLIV